MEQVTVEDLKSLISRIAPHPLKNPTFSGVYDQSHVHIADNLLDAPIPLDKVKMKASSIHGQGVFAKQKISKGELITIYPAHFVGIHPGGCRNPGCLGMMNSTLAEKHGMKPTEFVRTSYTFDVSYHYTICGHPHLIDNPAFLGHMINDGAKGHSTRTMRNQKDLLVYNKVSLALRNAEFISIGGSCVLIVATKEIYIEEEILVSYGYSYWTTVNSS